MHPTNKASAVSESSCERFRLAYLEALRQLETLRLAQWENCKVTLPQLRVLLQVRDSPGITTGQLAQSLGITVSTTSGLVAKLADSGLVARGHNEQDRRQIPLELTVEGKAQAGQLADYATPFLHQVAETLGERLDATTGALEILAATVASTRGTAVVPDSDGASASIGSPSGGSPV